jgi:hypothetical protein
MIIQNSRPCIFNASLSSFTCSWNYLPSQRICNEAAFDPWIFWHAYHSELTNLSRVTIDVLTSLKSRTKDDNGADMGISYLNFSLFGRAPLSLTFVASMAMSSRLSSKGIYHASTPHWIVHGSVQEDGSVLCPAKYRSMSGCGDFANVHLPRYHLSARSTADASLVPKDTRLVCTSPLHLSSITWTHPLAWGLSDSNGDKVISDWSMVSVDLFINYSALGLPLYANGVPPSIAPHRHCRPKFGRYVFLPETRWLHHVRDGGVTLLHHPCLQDSDVCVMELFATDFALRNDALGRNATSFQWVLTPYSNLKTKVAIVSLKQIHLSDYFEEAEVSAFVQENHGFHQHSGKRDWTFGEQRLYDYLKVEGSRTCVAKSLMVQPQSLNMCYSAVASLAFAIFSHTQRQHSLF